VRALPHANCYRRARCCLMWFATGEPGFGMQMDGTADQHGGTNRASGGDDARAEGDTRSLSNIPS